MHDLRSELLAAEAAHYAKVHGRPAPGAIEEGSEGSVAPSGVAQRRLLGEVGNDAAVEDPETKRRRILEETRDIDADDDSDSDGSGKGGSGKDNDDNDSSEDDSEDDSEEDSDDEDETAELQRELEKIKRERAEKREREEKEREAVEAEARERDIAQGNPLLNKPDFTLKRRWDDDVVFKNQARGTDDKGKQKEFINVRPPFSRDLFSSHMQPLLTFSSRISFAPTSTNDS